MAVIVYWVLACACLCVMVVGFYLEWSQTFEIAFTYTRVWALTIGLIILWPITLALVVWMAADPEGFSRFDNALARRFHWYRIPTEPKQ
jgi:hypothetical protein